MGRRSRPDRPGGPQLRCMRFTLRMLGIGVVLLFLTAVVIGIPFPGVWSNVMVPFWMSYGGVLILFTLVFFLRAMWLKAKAKHYETLRKMETDPRFR